MDSKIILMILGGVQAVTVIVVGAYIKKIINDIGKINILEVRVNMLEDSLKQISDFTRQNNEVLHDLHIEIANFKTDIIQKSSDNISGLKEWLVETVILQQPKKRTNL